MLRKDNFASGEYYHIYNRGNSKQDIFLDNQDRDRFVKLLYLCNSLKSINFRDDIVGQNIDAWNYDRGEKIVSIGAWVLMSNHFHLYITFPQRTVLGGLREEDNISIFMKKLGTAYSMYFNKKYERRGSLFEGRFKSVRLITDEQAKYLFSYIHLNPIKIIEPSWKENGIRNKNSALKFLDKYTWSSYCDYFDKYRVESKIISTKDFPDYFSNSKVFKKEIFDWLSYKDEYL